MRTRAVIAVLLFSILPSCRFIDSIIHDEEAVARVGNEFLYRSEVNKVIPPGASGEDSLRLALQYINSWATDKVFMDIAEQQLPKEDQDVTRELESYRRTLLKYRYEQMFVNERLDTVVTDEEVEAYYASHARSFILTRPVVKARLVRVAPSSTNLREMKNLMSSEDEDALWQAENYAAASAELFTGYSDNWIDIGVLASDMGVEVADLRNVRSGAFTEHVDSLGMISVAYILEKVEAGQEAPVEYCRPRIEDVILSARKHALTSTLERDLLEDARDKGKFEIY